MISVAVKELREVDILILWPCRDPIKERGRIERRDRTGHARIMNKDQKQNTKTQSHPSPRNESDEMFMQLATKNVPPLPKSGM